MTSISTHILDTSKGSPAQGVKVILEAQKGGGFAAVGEGITDPDGRVKTGLSPAEGVGPGVYQIRFLVEGYLGDSAFYPEISVRFRVAENQTHYHVPLLLNPFGYSTYRGS